MFYPLRWRRYPVTREGKKNQPWAQPRPQVAESDPFLEPSHAIKQDFRGHRRVAKLVLSAQGARSREFPASSPLNPAPATTSACGSGFEMVLGWTWVRFVAVQPSGLLLTRWIKAKALACLAWRSTGTAQSSNLEPLSGRGPRWCLGTWFPNTSPQLGKSAMASSLVSCPLPTSIC